MDPNEAIWVVVWQRTQDDRVDDTEDGSRRSDADGERERRHGSERRHASELSDGITRVLHELMDPFGTAHIALPSFAYSATRVVDSLDVAKAADGFCAGELGIQAAGDVFTRAHLDVERQLGV